MRAITSRLDRLEAAKTPKVFGRFICLRGRESSRAAVSDFLAGQGLTVGPRDLVLQDTPNDPGRSGRVDVNEPLSLVEIIPVTGPIEDLLAELD